MSSELKTASAKAGKRQSNIELLRIVCMLLLVAHHMILHGGAINMEASCFNREIAILLIPIGKICFDAFWAISCWFLVEKDFKFERFLKTWLQVLFYSVVFTFVANRLGLQVTKRQWFSVFFPILGNSHGFAAAYLAFYLTTPFLKMVADRINDRQLVGLVGLLAVLQIFSQAVFFITNYTQYLFSELQLFIFFYFFILFIKRKSFDLAKMRGQLLTVFLFCWAAMWVIWRYNFISHPGSFVGGLLWSFNSDESGFLFILGGCSMMLFFMTLKIPYSKVINTIAGTTFGILLIHDHNFFRSVIWSVVLKVQEWYYSPYFAVLLLGNTLLIFIVCAAIDYLRQFTLEKAVFSLPAVTALCVRMNAVFVSAPLSVNEINCYDDIKNNSILLSEKSGGRQKKVQFFSIALLCCIVFYWLYMAFTRSANIDAYYVTDHTNTAMDYFNMLYVAKAKNPWYEHSNYPALPFAIWKILIHMVPSSVRNAADGFALRNDMTAQLGYLLYTVSCLLVIWEAIIASVPGNKVTKLLLAAALMFSGPMIFLLERGNILLMALSGVMLFIALYDSDCFAARMIGYLGLSLAAAIKIYPAVLGLVVLRKRKIKETSVLVVMGCLLFFLPFFMFDGFTSIKEMLIGITAAGDLQVDYGVGNNYSMDALVKIICGLLGLKVVSVPRWVALVGVTVCLIGFILSKKTWQQMYTLLLATIWFPAFSYTYALTFLFAPLVCFMKEEPDDKCLKTVAFGLFFLLQMIPYALPMAERIDVTLGIAPAKFPASWGLVIINFSLVAMLVMILADSIQNIMLRKKEGII